MAEKPSYEFSANTDEESTKEGDVRLSLPGIFNMKDNKDGFVSPSQQIVGIMTKNRVFGGQTFAQFYMIAKKVSNGKSIKRLEAVFYGAGNSNLPIQYKVRLNTENLVILESFQNGKLIAGGAARLTDTEPFNFLPPIFNRSIPKPLECLTDKEAKSRALYIDPWLEKFGSSLDTVTLGLSMELFELRPVNFEAFAAMDSSTDSQKIQCWARLAPHLQHIQIKEPMFVPITICDYLACFPTIIALNQRRVRFTAGASLTHRITIHRSKGFDPKGFFFVENNLESFANGGVGVYKGNVFDECGQCILSFMQGNFNLFKSDDKNKL